MSLLKVYGGSDDLIEIEGDLSEEFNWTKASDGEKGYVAFSDGTMLSVQYDGIWRFHVISKGTATIAKVDGTDEDSDYSDVVTLTNAHPLPRFTWVTFGTQMARVPS